MNIGRGRSREPGKTVGSVCLLVLFLLALAPVASAREDLTELTLEELMNLEVTTVSRKPEARSAAAAALYVINEDDIRRTGVTSIPDALRMSPGTHVARTNSNNWSVSIRGFSGQFSNKLLVLMDGRTIYTPLFAGTFWDVPYTLLEDIDRIEVIRGPGGTLWGANAVNGVINVLSKSARETQGALVSGGGGTEERGFASARYGGKVGEGFYYRIWGNYFDRDGGFDAGGAEEDDWRIGRVGFRSDWDLTPDDDVTFQGEVYDGEAGQAFDTNTTEDTELGGGHIQGRWSRRLGSLGELVAQTYYDYTDRNDPFFRERRGTFDFDLQHRLSPLPRHEVVYGLIYRMTSDHLRGSQIVDLVPDSRSLSSFGGFVEDEISLLEDELRLTLGSKFEHNDLTGFEAQPTGRVAWSVTPTRLLWASISRAVRVPSRVEEDVKIEASFDEAPGVVSRFRGNRDLDSEELVAGELGIRCWTFDRLFLDLAGFWNHYRGLITSRPGTPMPEGGRLVVPIDVRNGMEGDIYGFELAVDAQPMKGWGLRGAYSFLDIELDPRPGHSDIFEVEGSSPQNQFSLRSYLDLPGRFSFDTFFRFVESLPTPGVEDYFEVDVRLARELPAGFRLDLVGQNLVEGHHREFSGGTEVERAFYAKLTWRGP